MRESFERLRQSGSFAARIVYGILWIGHILLASERRGRIRALFFKVTRHRPSFCRRVKEWGLSKTPRSPRVIVSLTSYPKRIGTVHRTIETLLTQDFKPDMVVLWLGEDKFPNKEANLPRSLLRLKEYGLTIGWCKDLRSYTKLVPSLRAYPEDVIVTADDDVFYRPEWLVRLYRSYEGDQSVIHCHLVRRILFENGSLRPYSSWAHGTEMGESTFHNLVMGVGGVLYPPHVLHPDVLDAVKFQRMAPLADDLWFWAMAVLNETKICLIREALGASIGDCAADNTEALMSENVDCGKNDVQVRAIVAEYPQILILLEKEEH